MAHDTRTEDGPERDTRLGTTGDPTAGRAGAAREWISESARAVADPAPLGLSAFALTTFLLSLVNAKLIPAGAEPVVFGLALAYGGIGQFAAGMWEFRKGNTFGATAFSSYGAFWVSFWALVTFYLPKVAAANAAASAVGWYLIAWGIFTTIMFIASFRTTAALVLLFLLLALTFYFLGFGNLNAAPGVVKIGGYLGIVTAIVAWYTALAGVVSSTFGKPLLPNPPLARQ
jgi:succinate-acetate transporter protein